MRIVLRDLVLVTAIALSTACQREAEAHPSLANAQLAGEIRKGTAPRILDVRTPEEYRAGHIPGAVNVPLDELAARLPELGISKSDPVVVHCERGPRAAKAEAILAESGYENVVDLQGHMKGWRESGLPVE